MESYLNYTCFQLRFNTGQAYGHSIYPKHPYTFFKGKQNPFQVTPVWGTPIREIRELEMRLRESVRQREQLKRELAEEYSMLTTDIKYFNTCAEFYMCKAEYDYIKTMADI